MLPALTDAEAKSGQFSNCKFYKKERTNTFAANTLTAAYFQWFFIENLVHVSLDMWLRQLFLSGVPYKQAAKALICTNTGTKSGYLHLLSMLLMRKYDNCVRRHKKVIDHLICFIL